MIIDVAGSPIHAATGGVELAGADPVVVLVHGAGMDATAWQLQTRYLAHRSLRPLAVDLPGHGRSAGPAIASIEGLADWLAAFLTAVDERLGAATPAHVVGHSMGTFIAMELALRRPELVRSIALLGTADAMPVHPELLAAAVDDLPSAAALMTSWGHDRPAHIGLNPTPGQWMLGGSRALVEASAPGVLATDFAACAAYDGASAAAAGLTCPVAVAIGRGDKMTPPKAAARLIANLPDPAVTELEGTGHMLMTENPAAVRRFLLAALASA